jgi:hypothetical protein
VQRGRARRPDRPEHRDRRGDEPAAVVEVTGEAALEPVASEVAAKLQAAIDSLATSQIAPAAP